MSATGALLTIACLFTFIIAAAIAVGFYLLIKYAWVLITAKVVISVSEAFSAKKPKNSTTKKKGS